MPEVRTLEPEDIPSDLADRLSNGCGGQGGLKLKEWQLKAIGLDPRRCRKHDLRYAIGGLARMRLLADAELCGGMFTDMLVNARWYQYPRLTGTCTAAFAILRWRGKAYWNDEGPVTIRELRASVEDPNELTEAETERIESG